MSNKQRNDWESREKESAYELEWESRMMAAQSSESSLTTDSVQPAEHTTPAKKKPWGILLAGAAVAVAAAVILILQPWKTRTEKPEHTESTPVAQEMTDLPDEQTTVPPQTTAPVETVPPTTVPPTTAPTPVVYVNPFTDLDENAVWYKPVLWAVHNGIVNGTSDTTFSPDAPCLRGQMVTMLWRAAGKPDPVSTDCPFEDVPQDSAFFKAVMWAYENGIAGGTDATHFGTEELCSRGQVITFLYRAAGSPAPVIKSTPFTDVTPDMYYYDAVRWAYENSISSGVSATEFGVSVICSRSQIATLLYRAYNNG